MCILLVFLRFSYGYCSNTSRFLQMVHTPGVIKSFQPQQRTTDDVSPPKN